MKKYLGYYLAIFLVIVILYAPLFKGFFLQDEWMGFGSLYANYNLLGALGGYFKLNIGHYVPLHHTAFHLAFLVFGLDYQKWVLMSLIWHVLNTLAVYLVSKKILKNDLHALTTTLLFALGAASYQATAWVGADINTHGSTFFALLSMYFFWGELYEKRKGKLSLVLLVVSLLFKETAVGLFALYFLMIVWKKGLARKSVRSLAPWIIGGATYMLFRGLGLVMPSAYEGVQLATETQSMGLIFYNILSLPGKVFIQVLLTPDVIMKVGLEVTKLAVAKKAWSDYFLLLTSLRDRVLFVEGFYFLALLAGVWVTFKRKSAGMIWGLGLVILTTPIFGLSPERVGVFRYVDSRNMYLASVGVFIFLIDWLSVYSKKVFWGIIVLLLALNGYYLRKNMDLLVMDGEVRKGILNQISEEHPALGAKVIFYTESDRAYYLADESEKTMPFLSGFGQTLMVWYQKENNLPSKFFTNRYLWEIQSQGYQEIDGRGFGYFRDFDLLKKAVDEYNVPVESVVAYSWNSKKNKLTDISYETREKIGKSEEN